MTPIKGATKEDSGVADIMRVGEVSDPIVTFSKSFGEVTATATVELILLLY